MQLPGANLRSSSYFIAERQVRCSNCGRGTRVLALGLPPSHEILVDGDWQAVDANAFIFFIAGLPEAVSRRVFERLQGFHQIGGDDPEHSRWVNHCPHCASVLSDDELHCEPGGFMPSSARDAQAISLTYVPHEFSALVAGYTLDPEFFAAMRRR
jgi:hypothetical protein